MGSVPVRRRKRSAVAGGPQTFRSPTAVILWWVWVVFALANFIDLAVQGRDHGAVVAAAILLLVTGVAYIGGQRPRIIVEQAGLTVLNPLRDHHVGWANVTRIDLYDLLRVHCDRGQAKPVVINAWAVHYSRRRKVAAQLKASRQSGRMTPGRSLDLSGLGGGRLPRYGSSSAGSGATAEAEAEQVVSVLQEYVNVARAEAVWADGTASAPANDGRPGQAADTPAPAGVAVSGPAAASDAAGGHAPADPRLDGWREPLRSSWNVRAILAVVIPAVILLIVSLV